MASPPYYGPDIAGVVASPTTQLAIEYGFGPWHGTVIRCFGFAVGTAPSGADLAFGAKIYTWPVDYSIALWEVTLCGAFSSAATVKTDTPEVGLGTVVGSGAVAVLSGTFENFLDGGSTGLGLDGDNVAPDVNGTVMQKGTWPGKIIQKTGGAARDVYLNLADAWAASANGAITFTGDIHLNWQAIGDV